MRGKLVGLFAVVLLALVGLLGRITYINATSGKKYKKQVLTQAQQKYQSSTLPAKRGDIYDRNGNILATSQKVYSVILDCKTINSDEKYVEPTVRALTDVLGLDEDKIRSILSAEDTKNSQYQILKKQLSMDEKKAFEDYESPAEDSELSDAQKAERANIKGVWFEEDYLRSYPFNELANDAIGFTLSRDTADVGLESYYNSTLMGTDGRQYGYINDNADVEQTIIDPKDGQSIVTTLDVGVQQIVEKYVNGFKEAMGAKNIGVIAMKPSTGEIIAMDGGDRYDLNDPRDLSSKCSEEEIAASQKEVLSIALAAKNKSYAELKKAYHTILEKNCPQSVKDSVTENVKDWMQKRGEKELQVLAEHFPQQYQKKVYQQFRQKFEEYNDIDNTKYMKQLEEKRDMAEQSALKAFVNQQKIRPGDRKKLLSLAEAIRPMEYEEKNKQIIIDQLKDRVKDIDRKAIEQICPDIFEMSFDEGKEAYQRIATGDFLPELKTDMLGRIRKRLEAMKKDECRSLVNKMIRDTGISEQTMEGFYPYDIRRMSNEACEDIDAIIANNALNTYAGGEAFEYPLLIFDSTKGENGKKGFVLTPDHVYYNGSMMAGTVKVRNIKEFYAESGLFHKGIYIRTMNNGEMKITGNYKADKEKMEHFLAKLNRFIQYLQEKPESRSVEYLAEEKHPVKCCYRCGYVYEGGNICPKCGSRNND